MIDTSKIVMADLLKHTIEKVSNHRFNSFFIGRSDTDFFFLKRLSLQL